MKAISKTEIEVAKTYTKSHIEIKLELCKRNVAELEEQLRLMAAYE